MCLMNIINLVRLGFLHDVSQNDMYFLLIDLERMKVLKNSEKTLLKIGNSVKQIVPFEAEMPSETINPPTVGDQADCNSTNTCHVDEFIYDDDAVDNLVKKGKLKKYYCTNCNSRDIKVIIS